MRVTRGLFPRSKMGGRCISHPICNYLVLSLKGGRKYYGDRSGFGKLEFHGTFSRLMFSSTRSVTTQP